MREGTWQHLQLQLKLYQNLGKGRKVSVLQHLLLQSFSYTDHPTLRRAPVSRPLTEHSQGYPVLWLWCEARPAAERRPFLKERKDTRQTL